LWITQSNHHFIALKNIASRLPIRDFHRVYIKFHSRQSARYALHKYILNRHEQSRRPMGDGFAIPVNIAYKFFNRIMIIEPSLGIKVTYGSVNRVAGVYVTDVADTNNKFELYDRIVSVNDISIRTAADYYNIIDDLTSGDTVIFKVERDRRDIDIEITVK
jgi:S1-C subfamily serine protease